MDTFNELIALIIHILSFQFDMTTKKLRSQSVEPIFNHQRRVDSETKSKKKLAATLTPLEIRSLTTTFPSLPPFRRRFSFFRSKRSQTQTDRSQIQTLQQIIDRLRHDLQVKTFELDSIRQRSFLLPPSNESIEQALQFQTILNGKLETMLAENDLLKRSIHELETFLQQDFGKIHLKTLKDIDLNVNQSINQSIDRSTCAW